MAEPVFVSSGDGYVFDLVQLSGKAECLQLDTLKMLAVIERATQSIDGDIEEVVVGSTFANLTEGSSLDALDPATMTRRGVRGRWAQTYEPDGFLGILVVGACSQETLSQEMKEWGLNGLDLARVYERSLDIQGREYFPIKGEEIAGGGRLGEQIFDYGLIYAAFKVFAPSSRSL